jgi:hypothetical protein
MHTCIHAYMHTHAYMFVTQLQITQKYAYTHSNICTHTRMHDSVYYILHAFCILKNNNGRERRGDVHGRMHACIHKHSVHHTYLGIQVERLESTSKQRADEGKKVEQQLKQVITTLAAARQVIYCIRVCIHNCMLIKKYIRNSKKHHYYLSSGPSGYVHAYIHTYENIHARYAYYVFRNM